MHSRKYNNKVAKWDVYLQKFGGTIAPDENTANPLLVELKKLFLLVCPKLRLHWGPQGGPSIAQPLADQEGCGRLRHQEVVSWFGFGWRSVVCMYSLPGRFCPRQ